MSIRTRRIYDEPSKQDGTRILVDRLWPRGMSKEKARLDGWLRDVSPSDELRKRFRHDPDRWDEFRKLYFRELENNAGTVDELLQLARSGTLTLLFAARDEERNNAVALKEYLEQQKM